MTDTEYKKYIREIMTGLEILRRYGNWAVSPWLIKKYGADRVEEDLLMRVGKQYQLRKAVYTVDGVQTARNVYYILERRKNG